MRRIESSYNCILYHNGTTLKHFQLKLKKLLENKNCVFAVLLLDYNFYYINVNVVNNNRYPYINLTVCIKINNMFI